MLVVGFSSAVTAGNTPYTEKADGKAVQHYRQVSQAPTLTPLINITPPSSIPTPLGSPWQLVVNKDASKQVNIILKTPIELQSSQIDMLQHGNEIPLILQFRLVKKKWYWFNDVVVDINLPIRIRFNLLTRQYQAMILRQSLLFESLEALQNNLLDFDWPAFSAQGISAGHYQGQLSLRINKQALSNLMQVEAVMNSALQWEVIFPLLDLRLP